MLDPPAHRDVQGSADDSPDDPSSRPLSAHDAQRTRAAHRVLKQLERYDIADLEVIERRALLQIRAMKVNLARTRRRRDESRAMDPQRV